MDIGRNQNEKTVKPTERPIPSVDDTDKSSHAEFGFQHTLKKWKKIAGKSMQTTQERKHPSCPFQSFKKDCFNEQKPSQTFGDARMSTLKSSFVGKIDKNKLESIVMKNFQNANSSHGGKFLRTMSVQTPPYDNENFTEMHTEHLASDNDNTYKLKKRTRPYSLAMPIISFPSKHECASSTDAIVIQSVDKDQTVESTSMNSDVCANITVQSINQDNSIFLSTNATSVSIIGSGSNDNVIPNLNATPFYDEPWKDSFGKLDNGTQNEDHINETEEELRQNTSSEMHVASYDKAWGHHFNIPLSDINASIPLHGWSNYEDIIINNTAEEPFKSFDDAHLCVPKTNVTRTVINKKKRPFYIHSVTKQMKNLRKTLSGPVPKIQANIGCLPFKRKILDNKSKHNIVHDNCESTCASSVGKIDKVVYDQPWKDDLSLHLISCKETENDEPAMEQDKIEVDQNKAYDKPWNDEFKAPFLNDINNTQIITHIKIGHDEHLNYEEKQSTDNSNTDNVSEDQYEDVLIDDSSKDKRQNVDDNASRDSRNTEKHNMVKEHQSSRIRSITKQLQEKSNYVVGRVRKAGRSLSTSGGEHQSTTSCLPFKW